MNATQFAEHLTSLKPVLPESVLAYAAELGTDDARRRTIAAFLTDQAVKYEKADLSHAKASQEALQIREQLAKMKKRK